MKCDHCGRDMETLEYTCSKCEQTFCTQHRLPESHDCIGLKVEKAERYLKREEEESVPWFKDEFQLSNVETAQTRSEQIETETDTGDSTPGEFCSTCGTLLRQHEVAACPHCSDVYCGEHLQEHRPDCDERVPPDMPRGGRDASGAQRSNADINSDETINRWDRAQTASDETNDRTEDSSGSKLRPTALLVVLLTVAIIVTILLL
jgi:predicted nucleic acid binding AN1-type Zn finger protein